MRAKHVVRTAASSLGAHKSRSVLTVVGIVVGILAVMLVVSVGAGAEALILSQIEGLGANTLIVLPGKQPKGPADPSVVDVLYSDSLKERDVDALRRTSNVPAVQDVMPIVFGVTTVSHEGETYTPMVLGGTELFEQIFGLHPKVGSFYAADDVSRKAPVAVIGAKVATELFGESDALGEQIRIGDLHARVIGVLPKKGQVLFFNADESIYIPVSSAQQYVFGQKHYSRIIVTVANHDDVPAAVSDITLTLRAVHDIDNPDNDDFSVSTQEDIADAVGTVTSALTVFLGAVAAISLVVGGVGIMNIMLVSVTERTKEIGLRKALGATSGNILYQFLLESVTLTSLGGVIGITLGALGSYGISVALSTYMGINWQFIFPTSAAVLGVALSFCIGLVFGAYPAYQASRKSPLEALRYE